MNKNVEKVISRIKSIEIQGATNIAKASVGILLKLTKDYDGRKPSIFVKEIKKSAKKLALARPDEPLNQNVTRFLVNRLEFGAKASWKDLKINFQTHCRETLDLIEKNEKLITENGAEVIENMFKKKRKPIIIFTHCNSSTVNNILIAVHKKGIPIKVYNSETRPKFQGRILAKNLVREGINVTMTVDSAVPFLISKIDPDNINADLVIVGVDVISPDGSVLNKIGSYSLSLSAKNAKVPFYVAGTLLKLKPDFLTYKKTEIEKREEFEIWRKTVKDLKIINYAFDIVPADYITSFITEFGILKPSDVKKTAMKNYKEIFEKKQI